MYIEKLVVCIFLLYKNNSPLFHGFWILLGNFQYCDPIAAPFVFFFIGIFLSLLIHVGRILRAVERQKKDTVTRSECRELMGYPALPVREDLQACLCFDMFRLQMFASLPCLKIWIVRPASSTELVLFRPSLVHDFAIAPLLVIDGSCNRIPIYTNYLNKHQQAQSWVICEGLLKGPCSKIGEL